MNSKRKYLMWVGIVLLFIGFGLPLMLVLSSCVDGPPDFGGKAECDSCAIVIGSTPCETEYYRLCKANPYSYVKVQTLTCMMEGYCEPKPPKFP